LYPRESTGYHIRDNPNFWTSNIKDWLGEGKGTAGQRDYDCMNNLGSKLDFIWKKKCNLRQTYEGGVFIDNSQAGLIKADVQQRRGHNYDLLKWPALLNFILPPTRTKVEHPPDTEDGIPRYFNLLFPTQQKAGKEWYAFDVQNMMGTQRDFDNQVWKMNTFAEEQEIRGPGRMLFEFRQLNHGKSMPVLLKQLASTQKGVFDTGGFKDKLKNCFETSLTSCSM